MKKIFFTSLLALSVLTSCEMLNQVSSGALSNEDIVDGLKTALVVGTDTSVTKTSAVGGYFNDKLIKILLPPEAKVITDNLQYLSAVSSILSVAGPTLGISSAVPDVNATYEKVILSMNRAAESAAKQAAPIFKNSITSLSITEGLSILKGTNPADSSSTKSTSAFDSTAATGYLKSTTKTQLVTAYKTPIDAELDKDLGLGFTTNQAWGTLVTNYNQVASISSTVLKANSALGFLGPLTSDQKNTLNKFSPFTQTSLGEYVTGKALDGLFLKVGDQERNIRKDPWKWISSAVGNILTKVFGSDETK